MELRMVNPSELEIDPLNERTENVGPHDEESDNSLEESIREQGLIQPPVARQNGDGLRVVVGQRRTLAAQAVGLDQISVIVVDWDDSEALEATITENVDAFKKSVSKTDRAKALSELMELNDWSRAEAASQLGVASSTIDGWLEQSRDDWEDTIVHVDSAEEVSEGKRAEVEEVSQHSLQEIRRSTSSTEEREQAVETVTENELSELEVREAKKRAEQGGKTLTESLEEVSEEKEKQFSTNIRARVEVTFTGEAAEALRTAAKDMGGSERQVVEKALQEYLSEEGYL